MVVSFLLSRTLVPTMARNICCARTHPSRRAWTSHRAPPSMNPLVRFSERFEGALRKACAPGITIAALAIEHRRLFVGVLVGVIASFVPARAVSRPQFLPAGRRRSDYLLMYGAPVGDAHRGGGGETAEQLREGWRRRFREASRRPKGAIVDNIGTYLRAQYDLQQHRHDRRVGGGHPDLPTRGTRRPPTTSRMPRSAAAPCPRQRLFLLPADIVSQILHVGAPAPIDAGPRATTSALTMPTQTSCWRSIRGSPACDARIQQAGRAADARCHIRPARVGNTTGVTDSPT